MLAFSPGYTLSHRKVQLLHPVCVDACIAMWGEACKVGVAFPSHSVYDVHNVMWYVVYHSS